MFGTIPTPHRIVSLMGSVARKSCLFLILFGFFGPGAYAGGKPETGQEPRNPEWVLAVTAFDVSALPPARQVIGDLLTKSLIDSLNTIAYRVRVSPEYIYYQEYARSKDRAAAAKALAAKRGERDQLLFQGDPEWKYRKTLKTKEEEIKKLEESLKTAEEEAPPIALEPAFKLAETNMAGTFSPPPKAGGEYRFCVSQKADAFLAGSLIEFHGRLYAVLRLYTLYSQSFQYEDTVIFSIEDTRQGVDELAGRVVAAVSGSRPGSILIRGTPEEAVILIDGAFAGRGEAGPLEHPPGSVEIQSFADDYQALNIPVEIHAGELAELYINLQPLSREALTITVPDESARVYRGALYIGQTPLPVEIPTGQSTYFHVETPEGKTASAVRPGGGTGETLNALFLQTSIPSTGAEGRVAKARRKFYGAWARFWIALPTAFLLQGISDSQVRAYNTTGNAELYQPAQNSYYIAISAWVLFGLVSAEVLFRAGVYIYSSWKDADPLVRSPSQKIN
ncbi:MAG: hypothetical protein LBD55_11905 [Treponema sp.]|nr:hypothetical protein [Treponema sp.]